MDKEFQQIAFDAETGARTADKLLRVYTLEGRENWVLIHVEVQAQQDLNFSKRVYVYNYRIFDLYDRSVASLAILADDTQDWCPDHYTNNLWGCKTGIWFPTVKLLEYKSRWPALIEDLNPFATVVMAHLKTIESKNDPSLRFASKLDLIKQLFQKGYSPNEVADLFTFIDWIMRLPKELEASLWQEIKTFEENKKMPYITSVQKIGRKEGREEGREEGAQLLLIRLLTRKFNLVPESFDGILAGLTIEQLEDLAIQIFEAESFEQFKMLALKMKG